ncbi:MAG: ABC transporter ATP-binding protein [Myxococcota bacterium]
MIAVSSLRFTYPRASTPTLFGLDFDVREGEIFGFLGPSGAGKSTTQKVLMNLLPGYEGTVRVLGRELREWGPDYYEQIGVSFELPNHYLRLTARENLAHFARLYRGTPRSPDEVLGWLDLTDDADKRVAEFSKGMKIRLNVARALLHRPRLLFLDEPTAGLDPVNARRVKDLILRLRDEGTTVFITTHDMVVADQLCDRVGFIASGSIRVIDAPAALKREHGRATVRVEYAEGPPREFPLAGLGHNAAFLELLQGVHIERLHSQETTLESVFIEVTGEELDA